MRGGTQSNVSGARTGRNLRPVRIFPPGGDLLPRIRGGVQDIRGGATGRTPRPCDLAEGLWPDSGAADRRYAEGLAARQHERTPFRPGGRNLAGGVRLRPQAKGHIARRRRQGRGLNIAELERDYQRRPQWVPDSGPWKSWNPVG